MSESVEQAGMDKWRWRASRFIVGTAHNRLPWFIAKRLVRIVSFGDGTAMIGWRWSKKGWLFLR